MKQTNAQVEKKAQSIFKKYDFGTEAFFTALYNYWEKYDLTQAQEKFLNGCKNNDYTNLTLVGFFAGQERAAKQFKSEMNELLRGE